MFAIEGWFVYYYKLFVHYYKLYNKVLNLASDPKEQENLDLYIIQNQ